MYGRTIALPLASLLAAASVVAKCYSFMGNFFHVMGKSLSVELSCTWTGVVLRCSVKKE